MDPKVNADEGTDGVIASSAALINTIAIAFLAHDNTKMQNTTHTVYICIHINASVKFSLMDNVGTTIVSSGMDDLVGIDFRTLIELETSPLRECCVGEV